MLNNKHRFFISEHKVMNFFQKIWGFLNPKFTEYDPLQKIRMYFRKDPKFSYIDPKRDIVETSNDFFNEMYGAIISLLIIIVVTILYLIM